MLTRSYLIVSFLTVSVGACSSSHNSPSEAPNTARIGGKADFTDPLDGEGELSKCSANNRTGKAIDGDIFGKLQDPIAQLLADEESECPTTMGGILEELRAAVDAGKIDCDMDSLATAVVTESHQLLGADIREQDGFRLVTMLNCGENGDSIFFSTDSDLGDGFLEIMARDESAGVFNYYDRQDQNGKLTYFGHSQMFVANPPKSAEGRADRKCAGCHTGGGLIMKELDAPWLHWEGDTDTLGAAEFIANNSEVLGEHSNGIEMEAQTLDGNSFWNNARLEFLKDNTKKLPKSFDSILAGKKQLNATQKLLEPLFCSTEVNIGSSESLGLISNEDGDKTGDASFFSFVGPVTSGRFGFGSVSFSGEDYDQLLDDEGYGVFSGQQRLARDTHFALSFIIPSRADEDFIEKLEDAEIVDREYIEDVLAVDLTRSISTDRCELLRLIPDLDPDDRTAEQIREATIEVLAGAEIGSPGAELLRHLEDAEDDHRLTERAFVEACEARQEEGGNALLSDLMAVVEAGRDAVTAGGKRERAVFEFGLTLQKKPGQTPFETRLHPETCELTEEFVPAPVVEETEEE